MKRYYIYLTDTDRVDLLTAKSFHELEQKVASLYQAENFIVLKVTDMCGHSLFPKDKEYFV